MWKAYFSKLALACEDEISNTIDTMKIFDK